MTPAPISRFLCSALAVAMLAGAAHAQGRPAAGVSSLTAAAGIVDTHHEVTISSRHFRCTARAGLISIRINETGEGHGYIFSVAYTADRPPGASPRPLARAGYAAEFYGTLADVASIAEFVRVSLTHSDGWRRPLFVGGERFGVWRAAFAVSARWAREEYAAALENVAFIGTVAAASAASPAR